MRYEDASGSMSSQDSGVTDARDDADALSAGSRGPATGNTITGEGTITGAAGADVVDNGPGKIVALEGASGSDTAEGGSMHVEGRFGEITMDSRGGYSYTPHAAKPEGGSDVFRYTLADADGSRDTATLTIDIGREIEKIDANAQQLVPGPDGVITLPPGVELSDIMVVGRNLVINLPDGTQMVIIDGAVFVPQLVLNGVEVPATNLASLLIDAEPQPAAGTPLSSGGNFAVDVPPLDPGVPLGDLIPPTELVFEPPIFEDIGQFEDDEPEIFVQPDGQPASVAAVDSVNEAGLPTRNEGEPAGSGESADGNSSDNDDASETTSGDILIDADDDPAVVSINGIAVTSIGQVIAGAHGNLTITSISDTVIGYTYTLTDNTSGNDTHDDFIVTVEDNDGDTATATLTIDIIDDVPTARNDTDSVTTQMPTTTGNVITSVGTTNSPAGADTVGADNASLTAVSGAGGSDSSFNEGGNLVVTGSLGTLTINAAGAYTYVAGPDSPGGTDVFTYTLTDGDGDTSTATLSITVPADLRPTLDVPTAGEAGTVVDEAGLPPRGGEPAGSGESADGLPNNESDDSETTAGTITFTPGDTPATVRIDGVVVTGTVGQTFAGDFGVLTITGYNAATGTITYSYTLSDNTSGDNTEDSFAVTVTDSDGDVASGTLVIDIIDDEPTARPDTDVIAAGTFGPATGNVITDASAGDAGDGDNGADTVGADNAVVTLVSSANVPANSDNSGPFVVNGQYGVLTLQTDGSYSYVRNEGTAGGVNDVFNYTITDGDGDTSSSTLTITIEDRGVIVGQNPLVQTDDDAVPGAGGNPGGPEDDVDAANLTGTLSGSGGDGALTFDLLTTGAPAGFTYVDGPAGSVLVQQVQDGVTVTVLTITVNAATGAYTVTQNAPIEHPSLDNQTGDNTENNLPFTINYTVTDVDGDSANGTLNINVDDDTPVALVRVQVGGTVDEDGVVEGADDGEDGDGNAGGVNDVPGESTVVNGNVSALFSSGADQPLTYSLSSVTSGLPALTSNGVPVTYVVSGNTLTASAGSEPVFTLVLNADTGAYTFTLLDQLDHPSLDDLPGDDTENPADSDITIQLGSIIQATDSDGDTVTADANGLNIIVDDDSPEEFDEDDCPELNAVNIPGESQPVTIDLPPVGADEPGSVTFAVEDGTPVTDREGNPVTSNGQPLFYFVNDAGVLEARVGDATGEVIFTLTLSDDGTTVTYDQFGTLGEGGGTSFNDLTSTGGGNAEFRGIGADDPATTVDILLSGEAAGADATVNTDSDSIGTANQSMDLGETIRIDFVSDLTTGGGTPSGFSYGAHVSSNSFIQVIPQVQGSQPETVAFTVWALDTTNTAATEPDRNPTGGFSDSTITPVTEVTVRDYLSGGTTTVPVTYTDGTTFVNVAYGISVRVNLDGSVTFAGVQQGDSYGISTGTGEFNAIAVQAEPAATGGSTEDSFDLGIFAIGTETVVEPIELAVPIALTDADGDSVYCDIHVNVGPPVEAPDITVTVNEAGLPVIGSDAASSSEIATGDLQSQVSGGTGPYTFTLVGSGNGTYGTLVLNPNGTFTYTLDTPFDTQPSENDGANPQLGAESFSFVATDSLGGTQTGTISVNIIDDVPSIDVTTDPESGVVLLTQDAETIGAAVSDTASSSADFSDVFELAFVAGADGAAAAPALSYTLGLSAPGVDSGLNQGASNIYLHLIGGKVVGSTSSTPGGVNAGNTVFDVSVNSSGVVTLTQYSEISHPLQGGLNDAPFADQIASMADDLVTLTASSTITDNDGDMDADSATINIGANLQFADHGPVATNDVDEIAGGGNTASGNVITGVGTNAGAANADNVGADVPGSVTAISGFGGSDAIFTAGVLEVDGQFGSIDIDANGNYTYTRFDSAPGNAQDVFTYTLTDADGDTSTATLTINIGDAAPNLPDPALVRLDDDVIPGANGNLDGPGDDDPDAVPGNVVNGTLAGTGGDGTLTYNFTGVNTLPSGFSIGAGSDADTLLINQGTTLVMTVQLNQATGAFSVTQNAPIAHPADTGGPDDNMENNLPFSIGVEVEDADGDVEPATISINVDDDTPTISASTTQPILAVDESILANDAGPTSFAGVFTASFGADGQAAANASVYTLGFNAGATGIVDTATNEAVVLSLNGSGQVEGRTATTNLLVFVVSVDGSGNVSLDQQRAVVHNDPLDHDEPGSSAVTLASDNLITLTRTITDSDGDSASATADIGRNLQFEDDGPDAVDDGATQTTENTAVTVNVFTNDTPGADGVNVATGIAVVPGSLTGTGVLVDNNDGTFTYTPGAGEQGSVTFQYQLTDRDGDSDVATVTINLQPDSTPTPANGVAAVDDDALPGGNPASVTGDLDANAGEAAPVNSSEAIFHGQLAATSGNDTIVSYSFAAMHGTSGTVGTETVNYTWSGNTLTATTSGGTRPGTVLFDVVVNPTTGSYDLTLRDNVLHDAGGNENDATTNLTFTVTDSDGDPANGTIAVTFDDDAPTLGTVQNQRASNDPTQTPAVGTLHFTPGADGAGSTMTITANVAGMTSGGFNLVTQQSGNVLTAYQDTDGDGIKDAAETTQVFTLTVNPTAGTSGQYVFDLITPLDPTVTETLVGGSSSFGAGPTGYQILQNTAGTQDLAVVSGYLTQASFNASTWLSSGVLVPSTIASAGTNGSVSGWGVDNNNFENPNELFFFDFGAQATSDPDAGGPFVPPVQGPDVAGDPPEVQMPNISTATFEFINYSSGVGDAGDDIAYVVHYTDGTFDSGWVPDTAIDGDVQWKFTADAGKFIADIQFFSGLEPISGNVQDLPPGKIDLVSVGIQSAALDETIPFTVQLTDGDGDPTTTANFTVDVGFGLVPFAPAAQAPLVVKQSITDSADISSLSLMNTDSVDNQRTMSAANNNSVLLGAIAAAGLGASSAAAAHGFGQAGNHQVLDTSSLHQNAAAAASFGLEHRESARDGLGGETQAIEHGNDNAGSSTVQREFVDKHSLTDADEDQGQAPSALSQGTELQASDAAQSNLTSAAVGMPSAEMLAGGNDNAVEGQAQGTAEVGRVLLDALAGGGRGPDIDAVIDAVSNQGHGRSEAALEALASHAGLDVSAWHTAGSGGFSGGHAAAMEPMLHHDAVIVAS